MALSISAVNTSVDDSHCCGFSFRSISTLAHALANDSNPSSLSMGVRSVASTASPMRSRILLGKYEGHVGKLILEFPKVLWGRWRRRRTLNPKGINSTVRSEFQKRRKHRHVLLCRLIVPGLRKALKDRIVLIMYVAFTRLRLLYYRFQLKIG